MLKNHTRTGDDGSTGLFCGRRVRKDSLCIEAFGTLDELNSALGLARSLAPRRLGVVLDPIQHDLFRLGAELASPGKAPASIAPTRIKALEHWIDEMESSLPALKTFILPGGTRPAAAVHLARTICRRAERLCVALARKEKIGALVVPYLNRLGDALFVLARWVNQQEGGKETLINLRRESRQNAQSVK
jgi:cob(I)alamin adenosyltransferase